MQLENFNKASITSFIASNKSLVLILKVFILFFLISFNYNLLRPLKISVVVTGTDSGASIIPFLKFWVNLPISILFAFLCVKLSHYFNRLQVFNIFLCIFVSNFILFIFSFPCQEALTLDTFAGLLSDILPVHLGGFVSMIKYWNLTFFYVVSELWGIIMLTVLSWGLINECVSFDNAKKYYALLAAGADSASIFSGQFAQYLQFKELTPYVPFGSTPWQQTVIATLATVIIVASLIAIIYRNIYKSVARDIIDNEKLEEKSKTKDEIVKPGLISSIHTCIKSKYLFSIAVMVISYYIVFNTFEVIWTEKLRLYFKNPTALNSYLNQLTSMTGMLAALTALLFTRKIIRSCGWIVGAMATPITLTIMALGFYGSYLFFSQQDIPVTINSMPITLVIGSAMFCFGRSTKYTIFDATKEMAFIPLPRETKTQSKIVIDALASRLGKSGGAVFLQFLIFASGGLLAAMPIIAGFSIMILISWIFAVKKLDNLLHSKLNIENTIPITKEKVLPAV